MAAKVVSFSTDNVNFNTLPGSTSDFEDNTKMVDDTIFGQDFKSSQADMIDWKVTANAVYKGYPGYAVTIKQTGISTAFTTEATTFLSGKSYQITNAAKQIWDPAVNIHVFDNGVDQTANVASIDYLFGIVTFKGTYTVTSPVTVTGNYLPLSALAKYQKYTLTQSMAAIDNSDIPTAQGNSGLSTFGYGLKTITLSVDGVYALTNGYQAAVLARSTVVIEICPDGGGKSAARGFFKPSTRKQSGNVGALELETMNWELQVPTPVSGLLVTPFRWNFNASDLSVSLQNILNAFINETAGYIKYLPDGGSTSGAGFTGSCVVADVTLSGGMGNMNTFACTFQGSGLITAV